jgi:hypothetical protein
MRIGSGYGASVYRSLYVDDTEECRFLLTDIAEGGTAMNEQRILKLPGFTAEASLVRGANHYQGAWELLLSSSGDNEVVPQGCIEAEICYEDEVARQSVCLPVFICG